MVGFRIVLARTLLNIDLLNFPLVALLMHVMDRSSAETMEGEGEGRKGRRRKALYCRLRGRSASGVGDEKRGDRDRGE